MITFEQMGAMETLTGTLPFGVTTTFLIVMIQHVWPSADKWTHTGGIPSTQE